MVARSGEVHGAGNDLFLVGRFLHAHGQALVEQLGQAAVPVARHVQDAEHGQGIAGRNRGQQGDERIHAAGRAADHDGLEAPSAECGTQRVPSGARFWNARRAEQFGCARIGVNAAL